MAMNIRSVGGLLGSLCGSLVADGKLWTPLPFLVCMVFGMGTAAVVIPWSHNLVVYALLHLIQGWCHSASNVGRQYYNDTILGSFVHCWGPTHDTMLISELCPACFLWPVIFIYLSLGIQAAPNSEIK